MSSSRDGLFSVALLLAVAVSPAHATDAGKLLPADTKMIVTVNVRRVLSDHRDTEFVQRYLDQWRLALKGDQQPLKDYYRLQELHKSEGISEQEFLARAKHIKTVSDTLGIDPLEDIDQITFASSGGGFGAAIETGAFVLIVEGRFNQEKFKAAIQQIAMGKHASLVDAHTLAITGAKKAMEDLLPLARDQKKEGLPQGMRNLLDGLRKEHVGVVVADVDLRANELAGFLKDDVAKSVRDDDAIGKFLVTQGADWLRKNAADIFSAGVGLSFREHDVRLQLGLDARKPARAKELHAQFQRSNFWSALALKALDDERAQELANIVLRQRLTLKETALITQTEVPYGFFKLAVPGLWLNLLSKDLAPAGAPAAAAPTSLDALTTRVTSIPLWTLPLRDKAKALPAGTCDVLEVPGVTYKSGQADPYRHRLDLFLPKDKKDFPVVVLVHGGAWAIGDNRCSGLYSAVGQFLASQGIGVVLPNYRLYPDVKHPEHAKDVALAVAWTHANLGKYGGNPRQLYLAGHSAGAHLVALLAADDTYLDAVGMKTADIKGVIAIGGVYKVPPGELRFSLGGSGPRALRIEQMLPFRGDSPPSFNYPLPGLPVHLNMFAPIFGDTPRKCALASPVTHVHRGMPPLLILVAEHDLPTLAEMADEFHQALLAKGCETRLLKVAKRNHHSLMFSAIRADDPAARAMLAFIRK